MQPQAFQSARRQTHKEPLLLSSDDADSDVEIDQVAEPPTIQTKQICKELQANLCNELCIRLVRQTK